MLNGHRTTVKGPIRSMSAVAYASLIRIIRNLEDEGLYSHESEVVRAAADAKLLLDEDVAERIAEAEELFSYLEETERVTTETLTTMREYLARIEAPARRGPAPQQAQQPRPPSARKQKRERRRTESGRIRRVLRYAIGLPPTQASAAPQPAPAPAAATDAPATAGVPADSLLREVEADIMVGQAERFLAFHAWLDDNERR
jgi:hypothetical protein